MRSTRELANRFVATVLPHLYIPLWPLSSFHRLVRSDQSAKRVLLVARNSIAADHMVCIADLLKSIPNIEQFVTTDRVPARGFGRHEAAKIVRLRSIHILVALVSHWDIVIFTNHPYGFGLCFPPWIRKLYVNHGLHTGKINNDMEQDGVYGRCRVIRPFKKPFYDCMFAASGWEREYAIRQTPELHDRVAVVGFLRADQFLEYVREQGAGARGRLGYTNEKRVVHIISTWGENSLYATRGQWILEQVTRLSGKYEFVVSIHPRFDDLGANCGETRDRILERFEQAGARINRDLDWKDYVTASDVTLSDHSSLCLYHVLLGHPVLVVEVDDDQYIEGSTFDMLTNRSSRLSDYADLDDALVDVFGTNSKQNYQDVLTRMLNYKGMAIERYKKEIELLLEAPGLLSEK